MYASDTDLVGPAGTPLLLFSGKVKVNSGDCTLYCSRFFSFTPSTIATIEFTSLPATAQARNADSVVRAGFSAVEH
jgi:hypothetical protein